MAARPFAGERDRDPALLLRGLSDHDASAGCSPFGIIAMVDGAVTVPACPPHSLVWQPRTEVVGGKLLGRCRWCDYERTVPVDPIEAARKPQHGYGEKGPNITLESRDTTIVYR